MEVETGGLGLPSHTWSWGSPDSGLGRGDFWVQVSQFGLFVTAGPDTAVLSENPNPTACKLCGPGQDSPALSGGVRTETLGKAWHNAGVWQTASLCSQGPNTVGSGPAEPEDTRMSTAAPLKRPCRGRRQGWRSLAGGAGSGPRPRQTPVRKGQGCRSLAQFHQGGHVNTFGVTGPEFKRK